jgi:hypothetical protein
VEVNCNDEHDDREKRRQERGDFVEVGVDEVEKKDESFRSRNGRLL